MSWSVTEVRDGKCHTTSANTCLIHTSALTSHTHAFCKRLHSQTSAWRFIDKKRLLQYSALLPPLSLSREQHLCYITSNNYMPLFISVPARLTIHSHVRRRGILVSYIQFTTYLKPLRKKSLPVILVLNMHANLSLAQDYTSHKLVSNIV